VETVLARAVRRPCPWPASVREETSTSCRVTDSRSRRSPGTRRRRRRRCRGRFYTSNRRQHSRLHFACRPRVPFTDDETQNTTTQYRSNEVERVESQRDVA